MKALLDNFAAVLGSATIGLLLLSITHEYGYFWVVGSKFQTFLTTTDYFSNAILWVPLDDWKQSRKEAAKDARQFWIFWSIVGVAALIWAAVKHG